MGETNTSWSIGQAGPVPLFASVHKIDCDKLTRWELASKQHVHGEETHVNSTDIDYKAEIDRYFDWFETRLPARAARFVGWLRKPSSRLVRFPLAMLLIVGGIFSFLPVLGLWMLPLGLILIAQDIPPLQKPVARLLGWLESKWLARQKTKASALAAGDQAPESKITPSTNHRTR